MTLKELISIKKEECPNCVSYTYGLCCQIDIELCEYLRAFGVEKYPIGITKLFKIEFDDFFVECILGTKYLKLWCRKNLGKEIDNKINMLEDCLVEWLRDKFDTDDIEK